MTLEAFTPINNTIIGYKRQIHSHPEKGWEEVGTTKYIAERLNATSLIDGLGESHTGSAFVLGKGKTNIFVRADIDALPTTNGPQHLCGHSTHTAALMGAFQWLKDHEDELISKGKTVTFAFQPSEEIGPSGARVFLDTHPEIFAGSMFGFAIHVEPNLPVGNIQIQEGNTWAAFDHVAVEINGKAAHVKDTRKGIDAIDGAAQIVRLFRNFQGDFDNFGKEIVFNFNTIQGGVSSNTIAERVELKGDIRWLKERDQVQVIEFFQNLPSILRDTFPGSINVTYRQKLIPPCNNDPELAREIARYMEECTHFKLDQSDIVSLGTEDFAYFAEKFRTLYSRIGIDSPYDLHDPNMVVSDEATIQVYEYWQHVLQWWINKEIV